MINAIELPEIDTGVVGLGLMGSSIAVALCIAGHPVKAVAPIKNELEGARKTTHNLLSHAEESGLLKMPISDYYKHISFSEDYGILKDCKLVQECVVENQEIKAKVYRKIIEHTRENTVITSNTSAIPISLLQELVPNPGRFLGIHWAEPAYLTRFMEITKGRKTDNELANWVYELAHLWGKEPTFLQKDIRGFVTNRLMYAVYREIFHLVASGETTIMDADKAFRYDAGSWMTFMGIFERMDQLGIGDYREAFKRIFPHLGNSPEVPELMQEMVNIQAKGVHNGKGLYSYEQGEGMAWEKSFAAFNREIYQLAAACQKEKEI